VPRQHAVPIAIARQFLISYGSQSSGLNNLTQGINAKVFRPSNHVDNLIMYNTSLCEKHKVVLQGHKLVSVFFPLTITVTEISVNGKTSISLTLTIIVTKIHAKTVT
jgi:hypothetical protein